MTAVLAFHFRGTEDFRREAFDVCQAFYRRHLPDLPVIVADSGHEVYNRAASRNAAMRQAEALGATVVALLDADVLIQPSALRLALDSYTGGYVRPFRRGLNLPLSKLQTATERMWPRRGRFFDPGAAYVISPEAWWSVGGMDENFTRWGGEDEAMQHALAAHGIAAKTGSAAPVLKLQHDASRWGSDGWRETHERQSVYMAIRDRDVMNAWIAERDEPGAVKRWIDKLNIRERVDRELARWNL